MQAHHEFMQAAIQQAKISLAQGGIPIGSVLVHNQKIIGYGHNQRIQQNDPLLHAEMDAIRHAGRLSIEIYQTSVLYTTLSPCSMCSGCALLYKIPQIIIGEHQNFMGEEQLLKSRGVAITVLNDPTCIQMMQQFIQQHPKIWNEDIAQHQK